MPVGGAGVGADVGADVGGTGVGDCSEGDGDDGVEGAEGFELFAGAPPDALRSIGAYVATLATRRTKIKKVQTAAVYDLGRWR